MNKEQLTPESVSSVRLYGSKILIFRRMIWELNTGEGYED
jgi:hypothetical protein